MILLDTPFQSLTPECLLNAIESLGLRCDGRLLQLNSFENRVYQVWLEDGSQRIAKFYRPDNWNDLAILEDHAFTLELSAAEIPVVPPLIFNAKTLHYWEGYRFALFDKQGGRTPELEDGETLEWIGRFLGRIHTIGAMRKYAVRPTLDIETFGTNPKNLILAGNWIPIEIQETWTSVVDQALDGIKNAYEQAGDLQMLRLHGDCHPGNLLWTIDGPHFVDFDDSRMGPAIQDIWMLLSGNTSDAKHQLAAVLRGYEVFREFDDSELCLVEALRTLRLINYSAWIAKRWSDPAFKIAFPWFGTTKYWQDRILELREQIALLQESPVI